MMMLLISWSTSSFFSRLAGLGSPSAFVPGAASQFNRSHAVSIISKITHYEPTNAFAWYLPHVKEVPKFKSFSTKISKSSIILLRGALIAFTIEAVPERTIHSSKKNRRMQRPPRRVVDSGSPTGVSQRGHFSSPGASSTDKVKDWVNANPSRTLALVAAFLVTLALLLTASKGASSRLSNSAEEESALNEIVEPTTKVTEEAAKVRAKVLDETEKIQGFSENYPTYELASDVATATLTEQEAEEVADKVDAVVSDTDLEQEKKDEVLHHIRYIDQKQYDAAPYIKVPPARPMRQPLWWALKPYESYYAKHPLKWYIPRLDPAVKLTPEMFHEHYRRHAMPVIINSESLRHLGYRTRAWTFDELRRVFPYNETKAFTIVKDYRANYVRRDDEEIDLGPGLASILRDEKLAKQGALRNYPRNLHIKKEALAKLEVDYPPLLPPGSSTWQLPTLWLGTSSADTPFHHDCCDNFVVMIAGVKRITLAPPTDWRTLSPICSGPNKSLCWAKVVDPNKPDLPKKSQEIMDACHKIVVDLQPGEILWMPAGWFHHIKNMGPTVMVNHWTRNEQQIGLVKVLKEAS